MSWTMVIVLLGVHQFRIDTVAFQSEKLCRKAIPAVQSLSGGYSLAATCVQVKP